MSWRPARSAPKDGTRILGLFAGKLDPVKITHFDDTRLRWVNDEPNWEYEVSKPDKWQPLPTQPMRRRAKGAGR